MAAPGSVSFDAEFSAETGPAQQSLKDYLTQIKLVKAEIAAATKSAKDDYQAQMLAARATGASVEELAEIQQAYAQQQVAIKATSKQLTDSILQGNYSALESEKALDVVRKQATETIQAQLVAVKALAAANSGHTVSGQAAASGAVQLLDGRGGIRTIESFLGNTLGGSGLFTALFPVIGAIQAGKLLTDLGEDVYEVGEKAHDAGSKLEEAMDAAHTKSQITIADLTLQADKLQDNIDKLSGHPSDGLRTAIDEAHKASLEFNGSLIENRKEVLALFKEYSVGAVGGFLSDTASTGGQEKSIDAQIKRMQTESQAINSDIDSRIAKASSLTDRDSLEKERQTRQNTLIGGYVGNWRNERKGLVSDNLVTDVDAKTGNVTYNQTNRNSGRIGDLDTVIDRYQGGLDQYNARNHVADLTAQDLALKGKKESDSAAAEAARKAIEAQKQAAAAQKQQWDDDHAAWEAAGKRSTSDEIWFWLERANAVGSGSLNYAAASKKADEAVKKANDERIKQQDEAIKMQQQFTAAGQKGIFGIVVSGGKGQADAVTSAQALAQSQVQAVYTVAEATTQYDLATGRISKYDAVIQLQTLHTQRYNDALTDLQIKLGSVQAGPEADAQRNGIQKQIVDLNARRTVEQMQDNGAVAQNTVAGALQQANQQWLQNTQNLAPQIASVYTNIFSGMNDQLANLLTGQKTSWGSFFSGIANQIAKIGLNSIEGSIFGSKSSSASSPVSGIGSFFGSLFGGAHANGGSVGAGKVNLIGERGPELFVPSTNGSIVPNSKLGGMFGASHNWNISVDARGATNPAEVEAAANRAVMAAAPHIVNASLAAQQDRQSRLPTSKR